MGKARDFTRMLGALVAFGETPSTLTTKLNAMYALVSGGGGGGGIAPPVEFVATAGQTSFTVTYTAGKVMVYRNGFLLPSSAYTATSGTAIVLGTACKLNDDVIVVKIG